MEYKVIPLKDGTNYMLGIPTVASEPPMSFRDEIILELQKENEQLKDDRLEMANLIDSVRLNLLGDIMDNDIKGDFDKGETLQNVLLTLNISTLKKAEQIIKESK